MKNTNLNKVSYPKVAYFSGLGVEDLWINYPWDAVDIDEHNREASMYKK